MSVVLAAIDLGDPPHHARILTEARAMAARADAMLAVVAVVPDFGMSLVGSYFEEGAEQRIMEDANAALHAAVAAALGETAEVKHVLRHGTAYAEILATAEELGADLIVMGAHRPEYRDYLIGTNAARVVGHAACSVLVLRD